MRESRSAAMVGKVDWTAVLIYVVLVIMGWVNIYAAVFNEDHASIFDMGQRYGMQFLWIGICGFVAASILLIDDLFYHMLAYPLYYLMIAVLIAVIFVGKEVNGAKSWIMLGSVAIQPTEFAKFTTALALARYISTYNFSIHRLRNLAVAIAIIGLPMLIIVLQNDTGSAVVYGAFLIPLFREGFNKWVYVTLFTVLVLFVLSFMLTPVTLLGVIILMCVLAEGMANGRWRSKIIYLAAIAMGSVVIYSVFNILLGYDIEAYYTTLISVILSLALAVVYAYRRRLRNVYMYIGLFFGLLFFSMAIDYAFDNFLQVHQQKRILDLLGLETDLQGWGYNVNQSKIAIGSGGLFGAGFLNGTQTKFDFVPEQSTDFIFCTVGEEWGFVGTFVVVALFAFMILRLMKMGERQRETFGRVYCYSVAAIFFFHVMINIGMTIGLVPVIGIPLPFFSYGGSSLLAFTVLYFVAVKLDSSKQNTVERY